MSRSARLRQLALLITVLGLLLGATAGIGHAGSTDQFGTRSSATLSTTGLIAAGQAEGLDTRLQRPTKAAPGATAVGHDSATGAGATGLRPAAWAAALAGVLERAGHPERAGNVLLRGPPGSSV